MLDEFVFQVVSKSNTLVAINQENVAFVKNEVVYINFLFKFKVFSKTKLSGHVPLSIDPYWMVASNQKVARKFLEGFEA